MRKPPHLLLPAVAVALTAAVGGAVDDVRSQWCRQLDKPSWQPPGTVFGPVWSVLYVLLAVAGARTLDRVEQVGPARGRYLTAYAVNLVLNAGWSWTFFRAKKLLPAVAQVLLLEASTVDLARRSGQVDRSAGVALLPYVAWATFATALTAELARRNRAPVR